MQRLSRIAALVLGALATVLAPCLPAIASTPPCSMSGCADSPYGIISSLSCCCAASTAPARATDGAAVSAVSAKAGPTQVLPGLEDFSVRLAAARDAAVEPPAHVPLFLLHASLLI